MDAINNLVHPDIVWHIPGKSWFSAEISGRTDLLTFLQHCVDVTNGSFILDDVHITGNDDHVLTVQRVGASHQGVQRVFDMFTVIRFEDHLQRERWLHFLDQEGVDEFFSLFDK